MHSLHAIVAWNGVGGGGGGGGLRGSGASALCNSFERLWILFRYSWELAKSFDPGAKLYQLICTIILCDLLSIHHSVLVE